MHFGGDIEYQHCYQLSLHSRSACIRQHSATCLFNRWRQRIPKTLFELPRGTGFVTQIEVFKVNMPDCTPPQLCRYTLNVWDVYAEPSKLLETNLAN
jgi:hypothetical protein